MGAKTAKAIVNFYFYTRKKKWAWKRHVLN